MHQFSAYFQHQIKTTQKKISYLNEQLASIICLYNLFIGIYSGNLVVS